MMPSASYSMQDQTENVLAGINPIDERFSPPGTDAYNIVFKQWWDQDVEQETDKARQAALREFGRALAERSRAARQVLLGDG